MCSLHCPTAERCLERRLKLFAYQVVVDILCTFSKSIYLATPSQIRKAHLKDGAVIPT